MDLKITDIKPGTKIEAIKELFKNEREFNQWLYRNFEEITKEFGYSHIRWSVPYPGNPESKNLYLDIPIIGTREFSEALTAYLKKAEDKAGSIKDLELLMARIKKDLYQNKLKAPRISLNFKRRYKNSTNYDVSRLQIEDRQYIVANDSIYKIEIPKIENTISFLKVKESITGSEKTPPASPNKATQGPVNDGSGAVTKEDPPSANEIALSYLFDLDASGKSIPTNSIYGGYDAKKLKAIWPEEMERINKIAGPIKNYKPDTFYRAVKKVNNKYDRNRPDDLKHISKRWQKIVIQLSKDPKRLKAYLTSKNLS